MREFSVPASFTIGEHDNVVSPVFSLEREDPNHVAIQRLVNGTWTDVTSAQVATQVRATALVARYGALGLPERPVFDLLLRYAVSEDGALHAEKYYRTVTEEFASTRPAFRWRQLAALARVTASEYGYPAPGLADARRLLKI